MLHKQVYDKGEMHIREMLFAYKQAFDILCGYSPDKAAQPSDCIGQAMDTRAAAMCLALKRIEAHYLLEGFSQ